MSSPLMEQPSDNNNNTHNNKFNDECSNIVIIFGRPGAGKSTVAQETKKQFYNETVRPQKENLLLLDLDVCIPDWMKENFAKGIYPTLAERNEFAMNACQYVEKEIEKNDSLSVLISFSFVNNDLREVFRKRFPNALWMLMDVTEQIAQERIEKRSGHFYKGNKDDSKKISIASTETISKVQELSSNQQENSEWNFAPVSFPHKILNGSSSVEENAEIVLKTLIESIHQ